MWSNQENRVRKQVKNPCEVRKIKASQNLHKIISTRLLIMKVVNGKRTFGYDEPIIYKRV